MKIKVIHKVASLVMTLVMLLGTTIQTKAALPVTVVGPSIYWGAMVNGNAPTSTNLQGVFNTFETRSGKRMSIIHWGQSWILRDGSWGEFQTSYFNNVRNHGSIPMLNWDSQRLGAGINQSDFQLRDVYGGVYDAYIQRWATDAKNWGHPFFLYFDPEMNGWWVPWGEGKLSNGTIVNGNSSGDYVRAWRHVHDIFTAVGAANVTWVWAPNHMSTSSQYPVLSTLYPGDAYVDWTGLSVYNKYPTWAGLNPLLTGSEGMTWFRNSYNDVLTLAPNKPMMLAQWASIEAGDGGAKKAAWITDALTVQIPVNFPKIKAVVWFNWQETSNETYPIETSQAATNAWAAGIASVVYAPNQFSNLNTSPIPPLDLGYTISGNAGVARVTLNYIVDGTTRSVTSQSNGDYSLTVPLNWTGTITPSNSCYAFNPMNHSYNNVTGAQTGQDFSPTLDSSSGCADVNVRIGGTDQGRYGLSSMQTLSDQYNNVFNGPVKVTSMGGRPVFATERTLYGNSFHETTGIPNDQLTTDYWFPWYDFSIMQTWISVGNPSTTQNANVSVYIAGQFKGSSAIGPMGRWTPNFPSVFDGPVEVKSTAVLETTGGQSNTPGISIVVSERTLYGQNFNETNGIPNNRLASEYWFPWYDFQIMQTWISVGNPSTSQTAHVSVYIAGQFKESYSIPPNGRWTPNYPNVFDGPVQVKSTAALETAGNPSNTPGIPIIATERTLYGPSFNETPGVRTADLTTDYWLPTYDSTTMQTWISVGNPSASQAANVSIYIAGQFVESHSVAAHGRWTPIYSGTLSGPLEVKSTAVLETAGNPSNTPGISILVSARTLRGSSFSETNGIPANQLDSVYWFTWYDFQLMQTSIHFGKP